MKICLRYNERNKQSIIKKNVYVKYSKGVKGPCMYVYFYIYHTKQNQYTYHLQRTKFKRIL